MLQLAKTFVRLMATKSFKPPVSVKGIVHLNRSDFKVELKVPVIITPNSDIYRLMPVIRPFLLKLRHLQPVEPVSDGWKLTYLNPDLLEEQNVSVKELMTKLESIVPEVKSDEKLVSVGYENWTADDLLKAVLPTAQSLSSFSQIGHVIHLNLREHLTPFKQVIAEILLDKVPSCQTVINKIDSIGSEFRNFSYELLGGVDNLICTHKEHGCTFKLNLAKVYWNPRLSSEHHRLVAKLKKGDYLIDVFAGVGPFAIPAAKAGCSEVWANDLNPDCYECLKDNCRLNKVEQIVRPFNQDAAEFIKTTFKGFLVEKLRKEDIGDVSIHVPMNLPAIGVTFLSNFLGLLDDFTLEELQTSVASRVWLHSYCFSKNPPNGDYDADGKRQVLENLQLPPDFSLPQLQIHRVRDVAPNKEMLCLSYRLPLELLCRTESGSVSEAKRIKLGA